jgi:hypothetical protein
MLAPAWAASRRLVPANGRNDRQSGKTMSRAINAKRVRQRTSPDPLGCCPWRIAYCAVGTTTKTWKALPVDGGTSPVTVV